MLGGEQEAPHDSRIGTSVLAFALAICPANRCGRSTSPTLAAAGGAAARATSSTASRTFGMAPTLMAPRPERGVLLPQRRRRRRGGEVLAPEREPVALRAQLAQHGEDEPLHAPDQERLRRDR